MKLELKNVKFYERMSEETNCFQADLFINGKKIAYVKNTGQGGCTDYHIIDFKNNHIMVEAEQYCLSLPKVDYGTFEFQPTLESKIDDLFEEWLKAKAEKQMGKRVNTSMLTSIVHGTLQSYVEYFWVDKNKKRIPIGRMFMSQNGRDAITKKLKDLNGENILNTNIPKEFYPS